MNDVDEVVVSYPIPHVIDRAEWSIVEGAPSLNQQRHVMSVPLGITPGERQERNLEMARLKWSPAVMKLLPGTLPAVAAACEEARVRDRAIRAGVAVHAMPMLYQSPSGAPYSEDYLSPYYTEAHYYHNVDNAGVVYVTSTSESLNPAALTMADRMYMERYKDATPMEIASMMVLVTSDTLNKYDTIVLNAVARTWCKEHAGDPKSDVYNVVSRNVRKYLSRMNASHNAAMKCAQAISLFLAPPSPPSPQPKDRPQNGPGGEGKEFTDSEVMNNCVSDNDTAYKGRVSDRIAENIANNLANGRAPYETPDTGAVPWGDLTIVEPALPNRLTGRMRAPGRRPADRGAVMAYPHRYAADKAVFTTRNEHFGRSAVLIDASGSMNFTQEHISEIVTLMPGTVIATYSGEGDRGELRVIARNGMWVDAEQIRPRFYGNYVDGPALLWLAQQQGPKYWVSDGIVTDANGLSTPSAKAYCAMVCMNNRILRVGSLHKVRTMFAKNK